MQLPALRSPFYGDDYLLLLASRDMSWLDFLRATWDPGADPGLLRLSETYWRPLSFLTFRLVYPLFGDHPMPYHLLMLGIHCAAIVLVWTLAWRLIKNQAGASVATVVFALHPAGFESVAWISAINSAALPLALGGWLAFERAVRSDSPEARRRALILSLVLMALALAYRETVIVIPAAMLLWYLIVEVQTGWRRREVFVLAGSQLMLLALFLGFSGIFSDSGGRSVIQLDGEVPKVWWYYGKQALYPSVPEHGSTAFRLQQLLGLGLLLVPVVALVRRQWLIVAFGAGFFASLVPYAMFNLGFGPRYFYFPSILFALMAGAVIAATAPEIERRVSRSTAVPASLAAAGAACLLFMVLGYNRTGEWVETKPDVHQRWVDQVKEQYPQLPDNGGLFVVDTPFALAFFDAYVLRPTVAYIYPNGEHPVFVIDQEHIEYAKSVMKPGDRMFIFEEFPPE
ncbi:MAG: glycosyltransferase family 39 protein [Dehalococcoidia bacterium]